MHELDGYVDAFAIGSVVQPLEHLARAANSQLAREEESYDVTGTGL